jgi:putative tricarboxylic transport membrane protein
LKPAQQGEASGRRESYAGPRIAALLAVGTGLVSIAGGLQVREAGGFSVIGPRQFPIAIGVGLIVLGILFLVLTTIRPDRELGRLAAEQERVTQWTTTGAAIALLGAYAVAFVALGYVVATASFFALGARTLGSRKPLRDAIVGVALSAVLYAGFTRYLGVQLPTGPVESLLLG